MLSKSPRLGTIVKAPIPLYNERTKPIDMLVLHSSPSPDAEHMINVFKKRDVSAHYIIDYDGTVIQCVDDQKRAWHAGAGFWREQGSSAGSKDNLNANSIGIEICSTTLGQTPYNPQQIDSLKWLSASLAWKYNIKPYQIVAHSDIAASRKADPGKMLPWDKLAETGVGFWFKLEDSRKLPNISTRQALHIIGYNVSTDREAAASAYAFLRRFIPHRVSVPKKLLDVITNVFPQDPVEQKSLLDNKITNIYARAVAERVIKELIREKREQQKQKQRNALRNAINADIRQMR